MLPQLIKTGIEMYRKVNLKAAVIYTEGAVDKLITANQDMALGVVPRLPTEPPVLLSVDINGNECEIPGPNGVSQRGPSLLAFGPVIEVNGVKKQTVVYDVVVPINVGALADQLKAQRCFEAIQFINKVVDEYAAKLDASQPV